MSTVVGSAASSAITFVSRETLHDIKAKEKWAAISKPQANKSFLIQQFFKNAGEVQGEQPCAMLLAYGEGGEKSDSFLRRGEQDRPAL